ncbi:MULTISPECIES: hypothetical protein [Gammaproteobacteria]|uniref:hypothetical protein n=1 Tax=Gammaproteobacteria TaxID=1236 RepID=UPI001ADCF977|nr:MULTISPECIES: hypothetical protein [Gammaproteobacteria]MBO9481618.1 hypothetical protein [Salinisphaera sp. G21_0]MBO9493205.1 hypothetical protein [Thalassotalea sp. G20_0]
MKVRKTLIFPLEHQHCDNLTRHSLLYRAANWLETTMRALQEQREEKQLTEQSEQQKPAFPLSRQYPFRRCLIRTRFFMPIRGRLPVCTHLQRPGPHHW